MKRIDCIFVFHFHLPYVYHIKNDYFEENWYYQNLANSYIPFLIMMEELAKTSMAPSVVVSISPVLYNMMENETISERFKTYLDKIFMLIEEERKNNSSNSKICSILDLYEDKYLKVAQYFERYSGDIITPFKLLKSQGLIEIITTPLTYPILPLLTLKESMDGQITGAIKDFQRCFLADANGLFLPECGWVDDIEPFLLKNSLKYIFLDERAVDFIPSSYSYSLQSGVRVFFRNYSSFDFLFGQNGIASNPNYREFYRDIGYERDKDYIKKYIGCEFNVPIGIKYHRITGLSVDLSNKEIYDIDLALETVDKDADRFLDFILNVFDKYENSPLFVSIFNAEIFGDRWFEGIEFLKNFFVKIRQKRYPLNFILPSYYINITSPKGTIKPAVSSWSDNGFFDKWLNERNDFIYPLIHEISKKFIIVASRYKNIKTNYDTQRILKQLIREIVMMQSSDWAVMISTNIHKEYAVARLLKHYKNSLKLIDWLLNGYYNGSEIDLMEKELPVFPEIDWRDFLSVTKI